jgi:phosphatidylglycerol:prolipoprotein diacylglycerol transferase
MGPAVLHLGPFSISSYAAFIDLGILIGLLLTYLASRLSRFNARTVMDGALWAVVAGIVGGRITYVAIYWAYFADHPREILSLSQGGLAFQGAFVAGVLGLVGYSLWNQTSFWDLADVVAPGLALGQSIGWIGCLLNGCGYGLVAKGPLAYDLSDVYGIMAFRYPTQAMISILNLAILVLIFSLLLRGSRYRLPPGLVAAVYLLLSSSGLFFLEFLRADETVYFGTLRWSQLVEVGEFLVALLAIVYLWRGRQPVLPRQAPPESP